MLLNSAFMLLLRCFGAVLLIITKKWYFLAYFVSDTALYLLMKAARGDGWYWMPVEGGAGVFVSLLMRVMIKSITDYTGIVQMRHPWELGGVYYTVNMFMALLVSVVSVAMFAASRTSWVALDIKLSPDQAWLIMAGLGGGWLLSFGLFLLLIKKGYKRTFFSTMTGKQMTQNYFLKGKDDFEKHHLLGNNRKQWKEIEDRVKAWIVTNWWNWKEEQPEWFTDQWQSQVDESWKPKEDRSEREEAPAIGRRRSSLAGSVKKLALSVGRKVAPVA